MFYVESKGHRYAIMAVSYPTLEKAIAAAKLPCREGAVNHVYDCSANPVGVLVAMYRNGAQL